MANTVLPSSGEWQPTPNRVRITRAMCQFLENSQFLIGRYELIDGESISEMGRTRRIA